MARILIIEDNADNLELAAFLLHSAGHTVLTAVDDEERIRAAGCDGYIAKPMGIQQFRETIDALLAASRG